MAAGMPGRTVEAADQAACRHCGARSDRRAKFCGECGHALIVTERKHVTLLMTDICGFTSLSEKLDPEQVRQILDAAFDVMLDATHRFGGTINQFLGDGVMAMFEAAPDGLQNHADRALAAAQAIQLGLAPLADEVSREHGFEFQIRIAVHTGPITVGAIGKDLRGDYVPMCATTAVALRLLRFAQGDEVVVSAGTRAMLDDRFDSEEIDGAPPVALVDGTIAFVVSAHDYAWTAAS